jgi:hypothetical protein
MGQEVQDGLGRHALRECVAIVQLCRRVCVGGVGVRIVEGVRRLSGGDRCGLLWLGWCVVVGLWRV